MKLKTLIARLNKASKKDLESDAAEYMCHPDLFHICLDAVAHRDTELAEHDSWFAGNGPGR